MYSEKGFPMEFSDRFKKRDDSYKREKVIDVITNILKDIHLKIMKI